MTGRRRGRKAEAVDLDPERLRAAVIHLTRLAASYERAADRRDGPALVTLRDATQKILRHSEGLAQEDRVAGGQFQYGDIYSMYCRYKRDPTITQQQMRDQLVDYFAAGGVKLDDDRLDQAVPAKDCMKRPDAMARELLGDIHNVSDRQISNWRNARVEFGKPAAFGVEITGAEIAEYVIRALDPFAGDRDLRDDELVLQRALDAMLKAMAEVEERWRARLASLRVQPESSTDAPAGTTPKSATRGKPT